MSTRVILVTLFSAVLLSLCSTPTPNDIRPEVAQPLNEALHLSGYWSPNKAAIVAKLNQASSVPNLNSDERSKIHDTATIVLAKVRGPSRSDAEMNRDSRPYWDPQQRPDYSQTLGYKGLAN